MDEAGVQLSLNETESLAMKAARGAGLGWGQAEDVGRAARWLAERGFDWSHALLRLLRSPAETSLLDRAFRATDRVFGAPIGYRDATEPCPLPWALAILAASTKGQSVTLTLRCEGLTFRLCAGGGVSTDAPGLDLVGGRPQAMTLEASSVAEPLAHPIEPKSRRSEVPPAALRQLELYAARTYVPATAQSRVGGAGAAVPDDD